MAITFKRLQLTAAGWGSRAPFQIRAGCKGDMLLVEGKGQLRWPSGPISLALSAFDITLYPPLVVRSSDPDRKEPRSDAFYDRADIPSADGKVGFQQWTGLFTIPTAVLRCPYGGPRSVELVVHVLPHASAGFVHLGLIPVEQAHGRFCTTFAWAAPSPGYRETQINDTRFLSAAVDIAIGVASSFGPVLGTQAAVIDNWIKGRLKECPASQAEALKCAMATAWETAQANYRSPQRPPGVPRFISAEPIIRRMALAELVFDLARTCNQLTRRNWLCLDFIAQAMRLPANEYTKLQAAKFTEPQANLDPVTHAELWLHINPQWPKATIKAQLQKDFATWNSRIQVSDEGQERAYAQQMLDAISVYSTAINQPADLTDFRPRELLVLVDGVEMGPVAEAEARQLLNQAPGSCFTPARLPGAEEWYPLDFLLLPPAIRAQPAPEPDTPAVNQSGQTARAVPVPPLIPPPAPSNHAPQRPADNTPASGTSRYPAPAPRLARPRIPSAPRRQLALILLLLFAAAAVVGLFCFRDTSGQFRNGYASVPAARQPKAGRQQKAPARKLPGADLQEKLSFLRQSANADNAPLRAYESRLSSSNLKRVAVAMAIHRDHLTEWYIKLLELCETLRASQGTQASHEYYQALGNRFLELAVQGREPQASFTYCRSHYLDLLIQEGHEPEVWKMFRDAVNKQSNALRKLLNYTEHVGYALIELDGKPDVNRVLNEFAALCDEVERVDSELFDGIYGH